MMMMMMMMTVALMHLLYYHVSGHTIGGMRCPYLSPALVSLTILPRQNPTALNVCLFLSPTWLVSDGKVRVGQWTLPYTGSGREPKIILPSTYFVIDRGSKIM